MNQNEYENMMLRNEREILVKLEENKKKSEKKEEKKRAREIARQHRLNALEHERKLRAARREDRAATRSYAQKYREKRGGGHRHSGLIAAVITLSVTTAILAGGVIFVTKETTSKNTLLENSYQRAYWDMSESINQLETSLSKLLITSTPRQQEKILNEVRSVSTAAEMAAGDLPLGHDVLQKLVKYLNQVSGYSTYLSDKLAEGGTVEKGEAESLRALYRTNVNLKEEINRLTASMEKEHFHFTSLLKKNKKSAAFSDQFGKMQESAIDYPEMIYDGPFSDGQNNGKGKALPKSEVTEEEALKKVQKLFAKRKGASVRFLGSNRESLLLTYNFEVAEENGAKSFVQLTKRGGIPVLLESNREVEEVTLDAKACVKKAEEYATALGYEGVSCIWTQVMGGVLYANLACVEEGIVCYPDLVKVKVAMDDGTILGLEGFSYVNNHIERDFSGVRMGKENARKHVSPLLEVEEGRLALVPLGNREVLAYEFSATYDGMRFYVYIDAVTGAEVNVLRVIETEDGEVVL